MDSKTTFYVFAAAILSVLAIVLTPTAKNSEPKELYRVYLEGKSMGLIKSKKDLEEYIDKEQDSIKKKYKVKRVYIPADLDIEKEITYENKILSTKEIYEKINSVVKSKEKIVLTRFYAIIVLDK